MAIIIVISIFEINQDIMENSKIISILNNLLHIINDRLEGFEKVEGKWYGRRTINLRINMSILLPKVK